MSISPEFAKALIKATSQIEGVTKHADNPYFKSKYADLPSVIQAVKKPLADNDITFVQLLIPSDTAKIETILIYKTGELLSLGTVAVPTTKQDAQGMGSAITYARRYGLSTGLGVPAFDDDGNEASGLTQQEKPEEKPKVYFFVKFTKEQEKAFKEAQGVFKDGFWRVTKDMGPAFKNFLVRDRRHYEECVEQYAKYKNLLEKSEGKLVEEE